ncbi:hypothetical protein DYU05_15265 [Mucilaginibacter terrenus]|uniref:DUF4142 domain-containing protein n=1 Tax=Mucilaginibacter terrenus TaxID=2482727 RepID=A0A3E2NR59_9SPHI|nr:hypothetical protein [Mucilaginibacter terrenus]RFZ83485.1 hypothetical protein DYU05_15265 [Mucilaginibacter terrenus]
MKKLISVCCFLFIILKAFGQTPDSLLKPSPVKMFTDRQFVSLMNGEDIYNMSSSAELNGYPSAQKALKYQKEIGLTAVQIAALNKINTELTRKKIEMGNFMVTNEKKLDALFRSRKVSDGDLIFYTNRYGLYMGELRNAILQASYNTNKLLTTLQVNKLKAYKNDN